jgi:hypothetical protein
LVQTALSKDVLSGQFFIFSRSPQLKRAMFLSAFVALRDPVSRAYHSRKISQGKRHNQALIALARRRCDVLFAGTPPPQTLSDTSLAEG